MLGPRDVAVLAAAPRVISFAAASMSEGPESRSAVPLDLGPVITGAGASTPSIRSHIRV